MTKRRARNEGRPPSSNAGARCLAATWIVMLAAPVLAGEQPQRTEPITPSPVVTRIESGPSGAVLEGVIFYSFAGVALVSAVGVVISRHIVRTAICLLFTLGAMAGFYFLLGANFVGAVQLIVYAGGTLVLIIFGVMLTGRSMVAHFRVRWFEVAAGAVACGTLLFGLVTTFWKTPWDDAARPMTVAPTIETFGTQLLTTYLVPFEVVSVLLLVAMIGAAYLARPERR